MGPDDFFVSWNGLLRITGKRTLSKLNAFDLVVTVGSLSGIPKQGRQGPHVGLRQ